MKNTISIIILVSLIAVGLYFFVISYNEKIEEKRCDLVVDYTIESLKPFALYKNVRNIPTIFSKAGRVLHPMGSVCESVKIFCYNYSEYEVINSTYGFPINESAWDYQFNITFVYREPAFCYNGNCVYRQVNSIKICGAENEN